MKKIILNLLLVMIAATAFVFGGKKGDDPRLIAVYFGDGTHFDALVEEQFQGFEFYRYTGQSVFRYVEEQKMMGNPNYLTGLYGELPEKMMFGPTNRTEKGFWPAHRYGTVFMLNDGLVLWQSPESGVEALVAENQSADYARDGDKIYKKMRKGKAKVKKAKKPNMTKRSSFGELEEAKGAKLDKKYEKMVGQTVPGGLNVVDGNGKNHDLASLSRSGPVILVFFHMNDIPVKKKYLKLDGGATKDHAVKINHKPMDPDKFAKTSESTMLSDAEGAKSALGAMSMMAMGQVKREISNLSDDILEGDNDLLARDAAKLYGSCTAGLRYVVDYLMK